jgi:hypothetical protein
VAAGCGADVLAVGAALGAAGEHAAIAAPPITCAAATRNVRLVFVIRCCPPFL